MVLCRASLGAQSASASSVSLDTDVRRWNMRHVLGAICLYFLVLVLLRFVWAARLAFITVLLGILLGMTLARAVDGLEHWRIPRPIGAPLVVVLLFTLLGIGWLLEPRVAEQIGQLREKLPAAISQVESSLDQRFFPHNPGELQRKIATQTGTLNKMLFPFLENSIAAVAAVIVVLFLSMYIAVQAKLYRAGLIHLIPPRARARGVPVLDELGHLLQKWLSVRFLSMICVGVAKGVGLWLLGIPAAVALGILTGLLDFVPFFGPIAAGAIAAAIGLTISVEKALAVIGLSLVVQQLEGHVLIPLFLRGRLDVPPLVSIVTITTLGVVLGLPGMLIGEPVAAATIFLVRHLYVNPVEGREPAASLPGPGG